MTEEKKNVKEEESKSVILLGQQLGTNEAEMRDTLRKYGWTPFSLTSRGWIKSKDAQGGHEMRPLDMLDMVRMHCPGASLLSVKVEDAGGNNRSYKHADPRMRHFYLKTFDKKPPHAARLICVVYFQEPGFTYRQDADTGEPVWEDGDSKEKHVIEFAMAHAHNVDVKQGIDKDVAQALCYTATARLSKRARVYVPDSGAYLRQRDVVQLPFEPLDHLDRWRVDGHLWNSGDPWLFQQILDKSSNHHVKFATVFTRQIVHFLLSRYHKGYNEPE